MLEIELQTWWTYFCGILQTTLNLVYSKEMSSPIQCSHFFEVYWYTYIARVWTEMKLKLCSWVVGTLVFFFSRLSVHFFWLFVWGTATELWRTWQQGPQRYSPHWTREWLWPAECPYMETWEALPEPPKYKGLGERWREPRSYRNNRNMLRYWNGISRYTRWCKCHLNFTPIYRLVKTSDI